MPQVLFVVWLITLTAQAAPFGHGHVTVLRVVSDSGVLTNTTAAVFLDEYATNGTLVQTIPLPTTGSNALVLSGFSVAEGALTRTPNGRWLCVAGYQTQVGVTNAPGTLSSQAPRCFATVDSTGHFQMIDRSPNFYNTNNIRAAASDGTNNFWSIGSVSDTSTGGIIYRGLDSPASHLLSGNARTIQVVNGQLYYSTSAGIFKFLGLPTSLVETSLALRVMPAGASPYAFAFNAADTVAYVCLDNTDGTGGVRRYTNSGTGTWSFAYRLNLGATVGARGLAVDWRGPDPVLYVSTSENTFFGNPSNRLVRIVDAGAGSPPMTLAVTDTNSSFRGVSLAPSGWPPAFQSVRLGSNSVHLTWSAAPGYAYRLEYQTSFQSNWTVLLPSILATNDLMTATDASPADPQRTYRAVLLP